MKITLRGRFLRTSLVMLVLSLAIGLTLAAALLTLFAARAPGGQTFLQNLTELIRGEMTRRGGLLPYVLAGILLLSLAVAAVCILLTGRLTGRVAATLRVLRQAADNLRQGELDFEILSCPERELDELCQALEGVRQRLKRLSIAEAQAQEERGLLMANLSHDLRTPIAAIKGYAEGIRDGVANTPEKQSRYLEVIQQKTLQLEALVQSMRDFSEYELGRMQYHFAYLDLGAFLRELGEVYRAELQAEELVYRQNLPEGTFTAMADGSKLQRVLDNLISNAVKYSRPGGTVVLSAEPYEGGLVIQVSDNGRGIATQALHHVFDSFYRADTARSSEIPGSGLGLAICRSIVDSHHGKIWLTSEEGEGTQAFLYLPLRKEVARQ